jgi:hypothetical protein
LRSNSNSWIAATLAAVIVIATGLGYQLFNESAAGAAPAAAPTFVGSETCAACHRAEAELWHASQHKAAMQYATDRTVLGDFNDQSFDYHGVHSRFLRRDGKFLVETDGPDGKLATFEVKYTFGLDPLQQYLVEFPDGRLQALSLAWDSRPRDRGGQRWFHLYPNEEIKHDDVLHWTKLNQNWNFMCAECHSTGVRKNYHAANDRFSTAWAEISVGCEACHGQGSAHVPWAQERQSWWPFRKRDDPTMGLAVRFDERADVTWRRDAKSGDPHRNFPPALVRKEVETCGLCHARRGEFSEDWVARPAAVGYAPRVAAHARALRRGRADARRGLQLRLVQAEQNVRRRRDLQRLPRAAWREASRARRRRLPAMPRAGQICGCVAQPSRRRKAAGRLRVLPHAGPHLHGGRSPA